MTRPLSGWRNSTRNFCPHDRSRRRPKKPWRRRNPAKTVQRGLDALLELGVARNRRAINTLESQRKVCASGIASKAGTLMHFDHGLSLRVSKPYAGRQIPSMESASLNSMFEWLEHGASHHGRHHANRQRKVAVVDWLATRRVTRFGK
jgi:hypothetical protein